MALDAAGSSEASGRHARSTVLFLALAPEAPPNWHDDAAYVRGRNAGAVVLATDTSGSPHPRADVVLVGERLHRHPALRMESVLVLRLPSWILRWAERGADRLSKRRSLSPIGLAGKRLTGILSRKQHALHRRARQALIALVAPRTIIRTVLPTLNVELVEHVAAMDRVSLSTAWQISRRWAHPVVTAGFPREAWTAERERNDGD